MTAIAPAPRFEIGRVISRLFQVLGRNIATFLALSALLVGLPTAAANILAIYGQASFGPSLGLGNWWVSAPLAGAAIGLIAYVANAILQGAVIHGTVTDLAGKRASFADCLSTGLRFILPLVGVGLVTGVAVAFGLVLFVVPGVLMALAWSVAAPAAVAERRGVFDAMSRSAELTRHHRGAILALAVINFLVLAAVQSVIGAAANAFVGFSGSGIKAMASRPLLSAGFVATGDVGMFAMTIVKTLLVQTLTATLGAAGVASIYYELRFIKEGIGAEQLAAVFD